MTKLTNIPRLIWMSKKVNLLLMRSIPLLFERGLPECLQASFQYWFAPLRRLSTVVKTALLLALLKVTAAVYSSIELKLCLTSNVMIKRPEIRNLTIKRRKLTYHVRWQGCDGSITSPLWRFVIRQMQRRSKQKSTSHQPFTSLCSHNDRNSHLWLKRRPPQNARQNPPCAGKKEKGCNRLSSIRQIAIWQWSMKFLCCARHRRLVK